MPWDEPARQNKEVEDLYRRLIAIRNEEPALRRGSFDVLHASDSDNVFSFRRALAGEERDVIVALSNSSKERSMSIPVRGIAPDGTAFINRLTGARQVVKAGKLILPNMGPFEGAILIRDVARAVTAAVPR